MWTSTRKVGMDAMVAGSAAHVIAGNTERVRSARAR
jgi:hypothetical protein